MLKCNFSIIETGKLDLNVIRKLICLTKIAEFFNCFKKPKTCIPTKQLSHFPKANWIFKLSVSNTRSIISTLVLLFYLCPQCFFGLQKPTICLITNLRWFKTYSKVGWVRAVAPGHSRAVGSSSGNNGAVLSWMLPTAATMTTGPMAGNEADGGNEEDDKDSAEIGETTQVVIVT